MTLLMKNFYALVASVEGNLLVAGSFKAPFGQFQYMKFPASVDMLEIFALVSILELSELKFGNNGKGCEAKQKTEG